MSFFASDVVSLAELLEKSELEAQERNTTAAYDEDSDEDSENSQYNQKKVVLQV